MPTERIQRRIDSLLDEADEAYAAKDWELARDRLKLVLGLDPDNEDAKSILAAIERSDQSAPVDEAASQPAPPPASPSNSTDAPTSFSDGRYVVKRFLGEGGKKKVYLAHDELLDRDIAFAPIKSEGLDDISHERITREAQAMGRLGSHPHIVTVLDLGDESQADEEPDGEGFCVIRKVEFRNITPHRADVRAWEKIGLTKWIATEATGACFHTS